MVTFLGVLRMVYTFRNLLGLLESATMLRTSTREVNAYQPNFSSRAVGIINSVFFFLKHYELISKLNAGLRKVQVGEDQVNAQSGKIPTPKTEVEIN